MRGTKLRRLDKEKALERLDEIEALTSIPGMDRDAIDMRPPGIDGEALDLMVKVAQRKGGVKLLVEKYAASRSRIIVRALGGILLQRAKSTKLKDAYLLFEFIEKLQRKDVPGILGITTAIKFQIDLAGLWRHTPMPESLYSFLQHCLEFTSPKAKWKHRGLSDWVELGAVDLLWVMCEHKIYDLNFDEEQRKWLEDKVREIADSNPDNESFQRNASIFFRLCK